MSDHSDNYLSRSTEPLKVSFGKEGNYSDAFVRSDTAPLVTRRNTRPLVMDAESLQKHIENGFDQLRTCQIIIDKFAQRMKIMNWAVEQLTAPPPPPPPPPPEPDPEPDPTPVKKGPLGKKLPPKPVKPAKPSLKNAKAAKSAKEEAPPPTPMNPNVLSSAERQIGEMVKRAISMNAGAKKRVQIALFQFHDAANAIKEGQAILKQAQEIPDPRQAWDTMGTFDLAKVQGKIYPLCNLHEVFKVDPEIGRLFPAPTQDLKAARPAKTEEAAPPPPPPVQTDLSATKNPIDRFKGIFGRK